MKTYQDLISKVSENERMEFCMNAISEHKASADYRIAVEAEQYYSHRNPTIMKFEKYIRDAFGRQTKDIYSANHKIPCRYYFYFVTQLTQYVLGNGAFFGKPETKARLGADIDTKVQKLAVYAQNGGVGFGFMNFDRLDVFSILEFVPLFDEENGSLRAGIRFWQLAADKPIRITLYEEDGYTEYISENGTYQKILKEKTPYIIVSKSAPADETVVYDGENYGRFPIVPLYNIGKQSELVGNKGVIDAYDLMASQIVNNVSEGSLIYWVLKGCDGMSDYEISNFLAGVCRSHVVNVGIDENSSADPRTIEVPYEANKEALAELRQDLFDNFMALDVSKISSSDVTATQIRAAYEPLNSKADLFEYQLLDFYKGILSVIGIDDVPVFKRSTIANTTEEIESILSMATLIGDENAIRMLPNLTPEEADRIIAERKTVEIKRMTSEGGIMDE